MALAGNDRHEQAEAMFKTGLGVREDLGTVWDLPLYQAGLADLHCQMGRWDEALVEAETGVEIAGEVGTRLATVVCAGVAAWIRTHRDDLAEAERLLAIAQSEIDRAGPQWGSYGVILSTAQLADGRGDQPRALEVLCDGWTENEHSLGLRIYLAPELVRAALAAGNAELARSVADAVTAYAPGANASSARGNALLARGLVDHDAELLAQATAASGQEARRTMSRSHARQPQLPSRPTVEGLTNRQIGERLFISRRTVQTHLSHSLTKLQVSSRVELAAEAARQASG